MDLLDYINFLERNNDLIRIKELVNIELQISEIADRINKNNGPALLFENNGTNFPVLINAFASKKRICKVLGVNELDELGTQIQDLLNKIQPTTSSFSEKIRVLLELNRIAKWMPKVLKRRGRCQEVIFSKIDLNKIPILKCWPHDGGKFITLPLVHSKSPITNIRNLGMYRMQIFSENVTGMHWHLHKGGAKHYDEYRKNNKIMPIAVALGGDPIYTYVATAPLPDNFDEYMLAGFLRKKRVNLVKCLTQPLEVPEDADFIIEGYVDTSEELALEGPFGDHTGFYSLADYYPRFHVTCITHRKNAVYPTTIVGIPPQEDAFLGLATEKLFLKPLQLSIAPEISDIHMPVEGGFHNLSIIKYNKSYPGQAEKIANALWGAGQMMFNKFMLLFDQDIDIRNYKQIIKEVLSNVKYPESFLFSKGPLDVLDHSSNNFAYGNKLAIEISIRNENYTINESEKSLKEAKNLLQAFENVHKHELKFNFQFLDDDISILPLCFINKSININDNELWTIFNNKVFWSIQVVIILENEVFMNSPNIIAWKALSNIDPIRDLKVINNNNRAFPLFILDATNKTKKNDGFERDWPNIVISSKQTIMEIDNLWDKLNLGAFIPSPSLKYQNIVNNSNATAEE